MVTTPDWTVPADVVLQRGTPITDDTLLTAAHREFQKAGRRIDEG